MVSIVIHITVLFVERLSLNTLRCKNTLEYMISSDLTSALSTDVRKHFHKFQIWFDTREFTQENVLMFAEFVIEDFPQDQTSSNMRWRIEKM